MRIDLDNNRAQRPRCNRRPTAVSWFPGHVVRYESYQYDNLGRLYDGSGVPGINTYDLAGNRTRNGTQSWTYNADTGHMTGIPYDSEGNVLCTWHGSDNIAPYFDIRGQVFFVSSNAVFVVGAAYDVLGRLKNPAGLNIDIKSRKRK